MPNEPLSGPIEAVIFDMDGLLIDSEAIYLRAMQTAARAVGREMSLDFCHSMVGVPGHECNLMIQELYGVDFDLKEFRVHVSAHVRQSMDERVPIKPGVVELLDFLSAKALPLAIATSAGRATAERNLGRAGLLDRFVALATRDDVEHPKQIGRAHV